MCVTVWDLKWCYHMRRYDLKGWESEHKRAVFTAYCTFPSPNRPSLPPSVNSYQLFRGASIVIGGAASCVSLRAKHASVFLTRFRRWAEQLDHDLKRHQFGGGFCVMSSALLNTHKKAAEFKEPYNKLMNGVFSLSSSVTLSFYEVRGPSCISLFLPSILLQV